MLVVISPAKRLDWNDPVADPRTPRFQDEANILAEYARGLSVADLRSLMGLSEDLARLNFDRFRAMEQAPTRENSRPAAFAFAGDTYRGLEAATLDADALNYADRCLRILSGLYGVLKPTDAIQPYRLEMGTRLETRRGTTLRAFWGDRIAGALRADAAKARTGTLLNCASREYFDAVDTAALGLRVVTPKFLEEKNGTAKVVGIHSKMARGAMARFVCERRVDDPAALEGFDAGGYAFDAVASTPDAPVFVRSTGAGRT